MLGASSSSSIGSIAHDLIGVENDSGCACSRSVVRVSAELVARCPRRILLRPTLSPQLGYVAPGLLVDVRRCLPSSGLAFVE